MTDRRRDRRYEEEELEDDYEDEQYEEEEDYDEETEEEDDDTPGDDDIIFAERKRWKFLGLPLTLTKYIITPSMVTECKGLLIINEDDCYIYNIQDVHLSRSIMERIFGLGTIICHTADVTDPHLYIRHVRNSRAIKNYLLKQSEVARIKRRTLPTQNISAARCDDTNHNGIPDKQEK